MLSVEELKSLDPEPGTFCRDTDPLFHEDEELSIIHEEGTFFLEGLDGSKVAITLDLLAIRPSTSSSRDKRKKLSEELARTKAQLGALEAKVAKVKAFTSEAHGQPIEDLGGAPKDVLVQLTEEHEKARKAMKAVCKALWPEEKMPQGMSELAERIKGARRRLHASNILACQEEAWTMFGTARKLEQNCAGNKKQTWILLPPTTYHHRLNPPPHYSHWSNGAPPPPDPATTQRRPPRPQTTPRRRPPPRPARRRPPCPTRRPVPGAPPPATPFPPPNHRRPPPPRRPLHLPSNPTKIWPSLAPHSSLLYPGAPSLPPCGQARPRPGSNAAWDPRHLPRWIRSPPPVLDLDRPRSLVHFFFGAHVGSAPHRPRPRPCPATAGVHNPGPTPALPSLHGSPESDEQSLFCLGWLQNHRISLPSSLLLCSRLINRQPRKPDPASSVHRAVLCFINDHHGHREAPGGAVHYCFLVSVFMCVLRCILQLAGDHPLILSFTLSSSLQATYSRACSSPA
ncbi:uncharacterized protein [Aegilops tauschii subsp. strangulata]|uniref:uncharacterized protein n=1 Tax=Aegilops tauschii subsp. strangulata TaxID=200361 RepID=UPI003CC8C0AE